MLKNIQVNGELRALSSNTLAALLLELQLSARKVATAVNGTFIPLSQRESCVLREGDRVEILVPLQGG